MAEARDLMTHIISKCDLIFEDEIISKELLIQTYAEFVSSSIDSKKHNVGVILHTGSICFDIVSVVSAAIVTIIFNESNLDDIITSLKIGDIVLYEKQRYKFKGLEINSFSPGMEMEYVLLERSKKDITRVGPKARNMIEPYFGKSKRMDGRGIKRTNGKRIKFFTSVFGMTKDQVPSVINTSSVIVMSHERADRIINGIRIRYNTNDEIRLLDIVTISYFTESAEYTYGGNPGKTEPILKISSKVSVARDFIFDKSSNKVIGLTVLGYDSVIQGRTELPELMNRKSLKYVNISYHIDSENGEEIINEYDDSNVFACTKEFLLSYSLQPVIANKITSELSEQVNIIIDKDITPCILESERTWSEYKELKRALYVIRKSDFISEDKEYFIIHAHSILNLFMTAVFPLKKMEELIDSDVINIISPQLQLIELRKRAACLPSLLNEKAYLIMNQLDKFYSEMLVSSQKEQQITTILEKNHDKKIAIIVPKAYYSQIIDTLKFYSLMDSRKNLFVYTANKFDNSILYDEIIVVGDFKGKKFNVFRCTASPKISTLLFDYESNIFNFKMMLAMKVEKYYNERSTLPITDCERFETLYYGEDNENNIEIEEIQNINNDMEAYIAHVNELMAISRLGHFEIGGSGATTGICAIGSFIDGEYVFFTECYKAYVFDEVKGEVHEKKTTELVPGDTLVFTRRNSATKDIVESIMERLVSKDKVSAEVKEAYRKSKYWKLILVDYMRKNSYSPKEISEKLINSGCDVQENTIRGWLDEDSRTVGPRRIDSIEQIALLVNDEKMFEDSNEYFEACRVIRSIRRDILEKIGRSIIEKLRGHSPKIDLMTEDIFENIENLAVLLQLDSISESSIVVPVNFTNRPIYNREAV